MLYTVNRLRCMHDFHNALLFYQGWLVDAISIGLHLVLGLAGVSFPSDTACGIFWLSLIPSSRKDAGGQVAAQS